MVNCRFSFSFFVHVSKKTLLTSDTKLHTTLVLNFLKAKEDENSFIKSCNVLISFLTDALILGSFAPRNSQSSGQERFRKGAKTES